MIEALKHRLHLLSYSWRTLGAATILRNLVRFTLDSEARNCNSNFDALYGTDTTRELTPSEAEIPAARRVGATMYLPSVDKDLDAMLAALPWPAARTRDATFVDIGSGKGRVVFLA